jgi:hypothetical protein
MKMTFKEAHSLLKQQADKGAVTWYGKQLEKQVRTVGHLEFGEVEMVLDQLENTYVKKEVEKDE